MQGIKAFQLFSTGFDKGASRACGLQSDEMTSAFIAPLEKAGAVLSEAAGGYWIALQVTTALREPTTCATFVEASVLQTTHYFDKTAAAEQEGKVLLWTHGELALSDRKAHGAVIGDVLRDLGRDLAEAWHGSDESSSSQQLN